MALYIRVMNGFWNHRKTVKLRTILGDDALWIMPRLWSYAAENQPDGDFSKYTTEDLSILIGAVKHPSSIRQALIVAGYMDKDGKLHDWMDHNGYHASFAARAKVASDARWKGKDKTRKDKKGGKDSLTDACSILGASFIHPSPIEVAEYGRSIGFTIDGQGFLDFYESKGWMIGKNKMKDWKAAVRTWKTRRAQEQGQSKVDDPCRGAK